MGTYIIRDVQDFLIERWGQKQMRSDVDLQLAAHAKQVRLENAQLREQNRVLRCAIEEYAKAKTDFDDKRLQEDHHAWRERYTRLVGAETILIALTATSQPAKEPVRHLCGARGFGQSIDDKCPGCDATSPEGQHD